MALFESHPDRQNISAEKVGSSWSTVIPRGAGRGEKFLEGIERGIAQLEIPNTTIERKELGASRKGAKPDESRPEMRICLRVRNTESPIGQYFTYFSARDFGKHLILSQIIAGETQTEGSPFEKEAMDTYFTMINTVREVVADALAAEIGEKRMTNQKGVIDIV